MILSKRKKSEKSALPPPGALRMVRDIENGINTNNVYNKNKWEQISSILV